MRQLTCVTLAVLLLASTASAGDTPSGKKLTAFDLKDDKGHDYDMAKHIGKDVVFVAFWATWCKPCKIELAAVNKLYLKYKEKGLVMVAVSIDGPDSIAEVRNYKAKFGYTFPVVLDSETEVLERYNPRGDVPFSMLVDRDGNIVETHAGFNPGDEIALEKHMVELLEKKPSGKTNGNGGTTTVLSGLRAEGTETFQVIYNDELEYFAVVNKLTIGAASGAFTLGVRMDDFAFPWAEGEQWDHSHEFERVWMQYRAKQLSLRAGDYVQSVGRGIIFSVRKIAELGLDTSIRGATGTVKSGPAKVTAFGGVSNVQNVDLDLAGVVADPEDTIAGMDVTVDLPGDMTIGARGSFLDYNDANPEGILVKTDSGDWAAGGSFEARNIADMLTIYFEGGFIRNQSTVTVGDEETNNDTDGHALYSSVSLTPVDGLAILVELKDYRRWDLSRPNDPSAGLPDNIPYHEAPTLERFDQIAQFNSNNTGGRLLVEYYFKSISMLVYANGLFYGWTKPANEPEDTQVDNFSDDSFTTLHAYAGVEKRWSGGQYMNLSAGYRLEAPLAIETAEHPDLARAMWHVESDIQLPISGPHSIGLRTQHRSEKENKAVETKGTEPKDYVKGTVALTYGFAPKLSLGIIWSYQTELSNEEQYANFAGEVTWRFSDWGQWSVYGGSNISDIICVSGVCRLFPRFVGVRTEFVARF